MLYDDRRWHTFFIGGDYEWLRDEGRGGRHLDARTLFFYVATVNTPAMALEMVGAGSQYAGTDKDADDDAESEKITTKKRKKRNDNNIVVHL